MDFVIWESAAPVGAVGLDSIENVERARLLGRGVSMREGFSPQAQFRVSKRPKSTTFVDDLSNLDSVKVCSARLVAFLQRQRLAHLEYLPVRILDQRGRLATEDYRIVNPCPAQAVLDLERSGPRFSAMRKTTIVELKKFVIDTGRLDRTFRVFRVQEFPSPVLIDRELAEAMSEEGFVGPDFVELEDYES